MQIEVFHDTACPWCRIGKQHLKQALAQWHGTEVSLTYRAFLLNPNIPSSGYAFHDYMHAKGGGAVPLEQWFAAPRAMGEQAGLVFNFERIEDAPNTLLSHKLIAAAPDAQRETLIDAVYGAYFEEGRNIGDEAVLLAIAGEIGLDAGMMRKRLHADETEQRVQDDLRRGQQLGVTGVPFFVFDQRLAFSGAQRPETILQVMQQAAAMPTEEQAS